MTQELTQMSIDPIFVELKLIHSLTFVARTILLKKQVHAWYVHGRKCNTCMEFFFSSSFTRRIFKQEDLKIKANNSNNKKNRNVTHSTFF